MPNPITIHGLSAVPASAHTLLTKTPIYPAPSSPPAPTPVSTTPIPDSELAKRINAYALSHLPEPTYNHSLRVYHFGLAIKRYRFLSAADWSFSDETFFLACVLHDIGTTEENLRSTRLSFEFQGAILALRVLQQSDTDGDAPGENEGCTSREQAESIAEAIIRHQDLCSVGKITALGQLLQLATIFGMLSFPHQPSSDSAIHVPHPSDAVIDNTGTYADLVHPDTIKDVTAHFPRRHWSACFAATVQRENSLKPWAHTTALGEEEFPAKVLGNKLMEAYE